MTKNFKVHTGGSKFRYFDTLLAATDFTNEVARRTKVILSIEAVKTTVSHDIREALVRSAIAVVRDRVPGKSEDEYRLAESRLKTAIVRRRRGNRVEYTLSVPEANLMLARTEVL